MDSILSAKLLAIPGAFLTAGYLTFASQNCLPLLCKQPASVSTPLLAGAYYRGVAVAMPTTLVASAAYAYLAYTFRAQRTIYGVAGAAVLLNLPVTRVIMMSGINRLIETSKQSSVEQEKAGQSGEVVRLLQVWTAQNAVRAVLAFAGGVAGLWAVMA
ncbi:hypothetical protein LTR85_010881 [Meristemomyces frigidus]|nr:hypothetical protein LTR85_010881 [Meristemomyces frigidus]